MRVATIAFDHRVKGTRRQLTVVTGGGGPKRPQSRAECVGGPRPCPYVSCRHHLFLEVHPNGNIKLPHGKREPEELKPSCSLDVADGGKLTARGVALVLNLSHARIQQIEAVALDKVQHELMRRRRER